jgi:dTDP-4-amino-4,6-dideoxygalactose transaminase
MNAVVSRQEAAKADEVPFFTQAHAFEELWPLISRHVGEVMDRGKYSHGRKVSEFEKALATHTGARYVIGVNNGTDALTLLLRAVGLQPGAEVIVPAFSFVASASAVSLARGRPVFADIEPETYCIDPDSAARAVTGQTRAIMPVHLFCQLAAMDRIRDLADDRGLAIVEDSAEAIGMRWDGVHAGLLGAGGVISFFPTKTLGAVGDAGAIVTDDPQVAEQASILRHHGRMGKTIDHIAGISNLSGISGTNSKMDDIQAAVLLAKLSRLDADIAERARLAEAYSERLRDIPGVLRLPAVAARAVPVDAVYYVYLIEVERRDELAAHLTQAGIGTEIYYPCPLHLQPCFADLGYREGDFPNAEAACRRALALPFYPGLSFTQVDRVCDAIRSFMRIGRR